MYLQVRLFHSSAKDKSTRQRHGKCEIVPIGAKFDIISVKLTDKGIEIEMDLVNKGGEKYGI